MRISDWSSDVCSSDLGEKRERRSDTRATLDGNGQVIHARDTPGGFFLYRFHFDLHYIPVLWARYLVGAAAMFMLIAILSGIVPHKKIFADFFMLRFGKGHRDRKSVVRESVCQYV